MNKLPPPAYDPLSMRIIEHILKSGEAKESDLEIFATYKPLERCLEQLTKDGLLELFYKSKGRKARYYRLTSKGRCCAMLIALQHEAYIGHLDLEKNSFSDKLEDLYNSNRARWAFGWVPAQLSTS